MKVIPETSCAH